MRHLHLFRLDYAIDDYNTELDCTTAINNSTCSPSSSRRRLESRLSCDVHEGTGKTGTCPRDERTSIRDYVSDSTDGESYLTDEGQDIMHSWYLVAHATLTINRKDWPPAT